MNRPQIVPIRTPSLGDTSYFVHLDGVAMVVDPQRDIARVESLLDGTGTDLSAVVETHLHNDYTSGGPQLADLGARLIVPAAAAPAYRHEAAYHTEAVEIGPLHLVPIHTPGHTPEHTSYVLRFEGQDLAVFSGGSLLVGAAGRSDLLGDERAESLSRLQFESVRRLASLDDDVELLPTHGQGSFCAAGTGGTTSSTIGAERRTNPVLQFEDADAFVDDQLTGLASHPSYYRYMGPINLIGIGPVPAVPPAMDPEELERRLDEVTVIDARDRWDHATAHIPGSIWVGESDSFSAWVGWLLDIDEPYVLVADPKKVEALHTELARIGYDAMIGHLTMPAWTDAGLPVESTEAVKLADWPAPDQIIDVRDDHERSDPDISPTVGAHLPDIDSGTLTPIDQTRPVGVVCASGYRASIAGSVLQRLGYEPIVLADTGAADLAKLQAD